MNLEVRLLKYRDELGWTQLQVAAALKVPRELISMWENGTRRPNLRQLEDLAQLFDTTASYLLGEKGSSSQPARPKLLLRGFDNASPEATIEIGRWLKFLDHWSDLLDESECPGRGQPPKKIDQGPDVSDIRKASKLAAEVREYFELGLFCLPDLYAFLNDHSMLVYQAPLGSIGDGHQGISGAFYNHPKLGYCVLINSQTSRGRQTFTLAHEFAHALYHYGTRDCIVNLQGECSSKEQFADAFAAHFLVPSRGLKEIVEANEWAKPKQLSEYGVLMLAHYYSVSYPFMLNRLAFEGHITGEQKSLWQQYSPRSLARHVGIDPEHFQSRVDSEVYLNRYPASVLNKVRWFIENDHLSVGQAADLLRLDRITIQVDLLQKPAQASDEEKRETKEFAHTYGSDG